MGFWVLALVLSLVVGVVVFGELRMNAFHQGLRAPLSEVFADLSPEARDILSAMLALESGNRSSFAARYHNLGNLTAPATYPGPTIVQPNADWEYKELSYSPGPNSEWQPDPNSSIFFRRRIAQRWRTYPDDPTFLTDFRTILKLPRYRAAWEGLKVGSVEQFVTGLHDGGYFTLPPDQYLAGLKKHFPTNGANS